MFPGLDQTKTQIIDANQELLREEVLEYMCKRCKWIECENVVRIDAIYQLETKINDFKISQKSSSSSEGIPKEVKDEIERT